MSAWLSAEVVVRLAQHRLKQPDKVKKALRDWMYAVWRCSQPAGVSARSLAIKLEYRYETMWVMVHKIRATLAERGAWQLTGPAVLGTVTIPVTKRAQGDPVSRPPVVAAMAVQEDPAPSAPDVLRVEIAATPEPKDADLLAVARERHVEPHADVQFTYVQNRYPGNHRLFEWLVRRAMGEPWRPRSVLALAAP